MTLQREAPALQLKLDTGGGSAACGLPRCKKNPLAPRLTRPANYPTTRNLRDGIKLLTKMNVSDIP
jgi:hypothetical protein